MTNSRAASAKALELIDEHIATGTEATYTITATMDLLAKYAEIIIYITGTMTASASMELKINAITDYNNTFIKQIGTGLSGAVTDADGEHQLLHPTILTGASVFGINVSITSLILAAGTRCLSIKSEGHSSEVGLMTSHSETVATSDPITSIIIETSTSTWATNTQITTYGVLR